MSQRSHFMAAQRSSAQNIELASDCDQFDIDWSRALAPYTPTKVNPRLPGHQADLLDVQPKDSVQGRLESWEDIEQRYRSYARSEMDFSSDDPYRSIDDSTKLVLGTLALPGGLVRGTCKRLFGDYPELVTTWQLHAVAHALFDPQKNFWGTTAWSDVCCRAEALSRKRAAVTTQVKELIQLGEVG